jgi:hypothetical protein
MVSLLIELPFGMGWGQTNTNAMELGIISCRKFRYSFLDHADNPRQRSAQLLRYGCYDGNGAPHRISYQAELVSIEPSTRRSGSPLSASRNILRRSRGINSLGIRYTLPPRARFSRPQCISLDKLRNGLAPRTFAQFCPDGCAKQMSIISVTSILQRRAFRSSMGRRVRIL